MIDEVKEHLLNLIFPKGNSCVACDREISLDAVHRYGLCSNCLKRVHFIKGRTCRACGGPIPNGSEENICHGCAKQVSYLDECIACFGYSGVGKDLIMKFKYERETFLGESLSYIMADIVKASLGETYDMIVAVPLHERRWAERGFNQMDIIGEHLSKQLNVEYVPSILMRTKDSPRLKNLDRYERKEIMEDLFSADSTVVLGKKILLIDDIFTTGATMNACARVLHEAGALNVYGLVLSVNFRD